MKANVGGIDKIIRLLIAGVIGVLYFMNIITGTLGIILLVVAGIFILTSLFSFCPIWAMIGVHTNKEVK
jgi:hypothetical protein